MMIPKQLNDVNISVQFLKVEYRYNAQNRSIPEMGYSDLKNDDGSACKPGQQGKHNGC